MLDGLRADLAPWYPYIKAIHVLSAAVWSFSTAVAWAYYLKPAFRRVQRHPEDPAAVALRDALMERFDRGAVLEHVAFVLLVVTAGLLLWLGGFDLGRFSYITAKVWIGLLVILPMEIVDLHLSHLGGNKARIRASGDVERYERYMTYHWRFFRITEPIVMVLVPILFIVAIAKPF